MNPKKTDQRALAIKLVEQGISYRAAARAAGISYNTVRRELAELGKAASVADETRDIAVTDVSAGLQAMREALLSKIGQRLFDDIESAKPGELRDLAVALGILDDKVAGRGVGGAVSVQNVNQVVVKTEWPEP